jgi:hypothetical protein
MDIGYLGVMELGALYRARKLSPVEVAQAVLDRMVEVEPRVNAMMRFTPEHAMEAAKRSEAVFMSGEEPRLLEGIPYTIKDLQHTKGVQTDFATAALQGTIPDVDAPCSARLKEAGGMLMGKTTSAGEWGWKGVSQAMISGITHNPWAKGLNAGASSSGAGVAAACGYGPLHQGGDGAGSIRMPAHFSGVYGLKPTHGRVANWPMSNNELATHVGPLTRSVEDAALMTQAMAGPHVWDYTSLEAPPQDYASQLKATSMKGKRIAYTRDLGHARVDPEVAEVVGPARPRARPLLLAGDLQRAHRRPAGIREPDGSGLRCHDQARVAFHRAAVHADAAAALRLCPADPRVHGGLRLPALAGGQRRRLPGRPAAARALAAARMGLADVGGVLLPLQLVGQPRGERPLRLHAGRATCRPPDRWQALRRSRRAAGQRRLRGSTALGSAQAATRAVR